jgi:hypothetical protein
MMPDQLNSKTAVWSLRVLMAAALFFGSEILLWTDPAGRAPVEGLLIVPAYLMTGAVLLDLIARYRVRDLFGIMTIAGIYGLINGLLINPDTTLFDIPRTLVTRVTGAHTLLGLEMLLLFLALTGGNRRHARWLLLISAGVIGLAWGTWVRWSPLQTGVVYDAVALPVMLGIGIAGIFLILLTARVSQTPANILLNGREWGLVAFLSSALLLFRIAQGFVSLPALVLVVVILALCFAMLWFRRGTKLQPLIMPHMEVHPLPLVWIILAVAIFLWTGVFAYHLPLIGTVEFNQLTFIVYGFTLYGLGWLPAVSALLGLRAYMRQIQAQPL